jgi:hypothetical protein
MPYVTGGLMDNGSKSILVHVTDGKYSISVRNRNVIIPELRSYWLRVNIRGYLSESHGNTLTCVTPYPGGMGGPRPSRSWCSPPGLPSMSGDAPEAWLLPGNERIHFTPSSHYLCRRFLGYWRLICPTNLTGYSLMSPNQTNDIIPMIRLLFRAGCNG